MNGCRVAYELPLIENSDFSESSGIYVHRSLLRKNHGETQIISSNLEAILSKMTSDLQTSKLLLNFSLSGYYSRSFTNNRIKNTMMEILSRLTFKNKEDLEILGSIGFSCFEYLRNQFSCNYLHDADVETLLLSKMQEALESEKDAIKALHNIDKKKVKTDHYRNLLTVAVIAKAKFNLDSELITTHLARLTPVMNDLLLCLTIHCTLDVDALRLLQAELVKRLNSGGFTMSKLSKIIGTTNFYKYLALVATGNSNQKVKGSDDSLSITDTQLRELPLMKDPAFMKRYLQALPVHQELLETVQAYANRVLQDPSSYMVETCVTENESAYHMMQPDYYRDPNSALCILSKDSFRFSYRELVELVHSSTVAGQFGSDFYLAVQRTLLNPKYASIIDKSATIEAKIFSRFLKSSSVKIDAVWSKVEEVGLILK